jgi:hypothetical protein
MPRISHLGVRTATTDFACGANVACRDKAVLLAQAQGNLLGEQRIIDQV